MNSIDLSGPIIPNESAAGFRIGAHLTEMRSIFANMSRWDRSSMTLNQAIAQSDGWLKASMEELTDGGRAGHIFFYRRGTVELRFTGDGMLACIGVFDGYTGALFGKIRIGTPLSDVTAFCDLCFDNGEDLHYPIADTTTGLALYAEFQSLAEAPHQLIAGIYVNDPAHGAP